MGRRAEESDARLVHGVRSDGLIITDDELLRAGWRHRREARQACATALRSNGQGVVHRRVVKVIIEGPIARLPTIKVDPLSDFVVSNLVLLTIVRECAVGVIGTRDVREEFQSLLATMQFGELRRLERRSSRSSYSLRNCIAHRL